MFHAAPQSASRQNDNYSMQADKVTRLERPFQWFWTSGVRQAPLWEPGLHFWHFSVLLYVHTKLPFQIAYIYPQILPINPFLHLIPTHNSRQFWSAWPHKATRVQIPPLAAWGNSQQPRLWVSLLRLCLLWAVWPWAGHLTSLDLNPPSVKAYVSAITVVCVKKSSINPVYDIRKTQT